MPNSEIFFDRIQKWDFVQNASKKATSGPQTTSLHTELTTSIIIIFKHGLSASCSSGSLPTEPLTVAPQPSKIKHFTPASHFKRPPSIGMERGKKRNCYSGVVRNDWAAFGSERPSPR